jgi:hypothetical protein
LSMHDSNMEINQQDPLIHASRLPTLHIDMVVIWMPAG